MKKKLLIILFVVGSLFFLALIFAPKKSEILNLSNRLQPAHKSSTVPFCLGASSQCLVVFVAPWCGYCRRSTPLFQAMLSRFSGQSSLKFSVVVTADELRALEAYGQEIGQGAYLDPSSQFSSYLGVNGFPTWILFDDKGTVRNTLGGAFGSVEEVMFRLNLKTN